ncbi:hypothetical protein J6590_044729 [Homalodisca vitripennis]|nr:hypothetical protein J6590_044729 [Homalodisca vitripennis]
MSMLGVETRRIQIKGRMSSSNKDKLKPQQPLNLVTFCQRVYLGYREMSYNSIYGVPIVERSKTSDFESLPEMAQAFTDLSKKSQGAPLATTSWSRKASRQAEQVYSTPFSPPPVNNALTRLRYAVEPAWLVTGFQAAHKLAVSVSVLALLPQLAHAHNPHTRKLLVLLPWAGANSSTWFRF